MGASQGRVTKIPQAVLNPRSQCVSTQRLIDVEKEGFVDVGERAVGTTSKLFIGYHPKSGFLYQGYHNGHKV
jgi:hypothetical protein